MNRITSGVIVVLIITSLCFLSCSTRSTSPRSSSSATSANSSTPTTTASNTWRKANAAELTVTINSIGDVALDPSKFPERDYSKKLADAMKKDYSHGIYRELQADKANGQLRIVLNLYRDEESSWPDGSDSVNVQVWGSRTADIMGQTSISMKPQSGPLLQYDLILTGSTQPDDSIKGTATGLVILDTGKDAKGMKFDNAQFRLRTF